MKFRFMPAETSNPAPSRPHVHSALLAVMLGMLTVAVYWPVLRNDFVNYDDPDYVASNARVQQGVTLDNIGWALTHPVCYNWHPLTIVSHMVDCQLFGLDPRWHHLTSLLFHAANSILLFLMLRLLTGTFWRGAWVAALFALHPLHVESVAWVAERKDVLSGFFGLLTLLFYVRHVRVQSKDVQPGHFPIGFGRDYWIACSCFALGLMSKPMLVTWPFVLLLLDYWPLGRFKPGFIRALVWEKIPFFCLTLAGSAATMVVQSHSGAVQPLDNLSLSLRLENAVISYCRYGFKILWPEDLAIYYPYTRNLSASWVVFALILLTGLTALFWIVRRNQPFFLMGWLWFMGTLVPVIGLVQVGSQSMADRYTYLPSIGILIFIGWGAGQLTKSWHHRGLVLSLAGSLVLIFCAVTTRQQISYWRNSETLNLHALAVTKDNDIAHWNLAAAYYLQGRTNESIHEYRESVRINPNYCIPHMFLGNFLAAQGHTNEALTELQHAVALDPANVDARYSIGCLLFKMGQTDAGISQFKKAVRFQTNDSGSLLALSGLLLKADQADAAYSEFQEAVRSKPADARLRYELGNLLANTPKTDEAIDQFQEAIRLQPDLFEAHNNLASLLSKKGRLDQAVAEFQKAIGLKPDLADAHFNLGTIYLKTGHADKSADEFQTVIRLSPDNATAHYYLGTILIKQGQMNAAVTELQTAIRLQPDYAFAHNKLGIALGSVGHLSEAISEFQAAVRLKPDYAEAGTNLAIALKMQGASPR